MYIAITKWKNNFNSINIYLETLNINLEIIKTYKTLSLLLILFVTISCEKDDSELSQFSSAYSIIVNNGKVLVSGWENINTHNSSVFWIDTFRDNSSNFNKFLVKGNIYKSPIDESGRDTYVYKSLSGETEVFKFNQAGEKE